MGYSMKQKIDICLMAEANPTMTQTELAAWTRTRFNTAKAPSQTTISRILAKKDVLIALKEHEYKLVRRRRLSNSLLRKVLLEWITQCVWNNIPITAPIILSSAGNFWKQLPENMRDGTGEFSFKWCSQFLAKININLATIDRDLYANRLHIWTFEEKQHLRLLLQDIDPAKIFTLQEVLVSHDLPLDKSRYKDHSDFITCMVCTNVDGSEKLDPLIIGRYEGYPCFESRLSVKAATRHGVSYRSNRKRWLTSTVFYDWLSVLDKRLALVNKDIILILDDTASHRVVNIKLQRIRLLYTSSSSNFLPMAWGVENDFRMNFRIEQYEQMIQKQVVLHNKQLSEFEQHFTMCDTFDIVKSAWAKLPQDRIKSAWKQSGLLPDSMTESFGKIKMFDDTLETKLFDLIQQLQVGEKWDVHSLLDLSVEKKINKTFLANEEIIQSCIVDNYDDFDHTTGCALRAPFSNTLGREFQTLHHLGKMHQMYGLHSNESEPHPYPARLNSTDMDFWELDNFQFDDDLNDLDMLQEHESRPALITQVQPMSVLAPRPVAPQQVAPQPVTLPLVQTPLNNVLDLPIQAPGSNTSTSDFGLNNLDFVAGSDGDSFMSPAQLISSEERLEIVHSFLDLLEGDSSIVVSKQAKMELNALYKKLLSEMV